MIKAVFFDVDGTLVSHKSKSVPESAGKALDKLREIRAIIKASGKDIDLQIDGGVTAENVAEIKAAGANVIVAGSAVFKATDRKQIIEDLRTR